MAERLIADSEDIPTAPPLAFQILTLDRNGNLSLDGLVNLVRLDPDLTAQILRICNSVDLRGRGVSSLREAALRVGTGAIAAKAMSLTVSRLMDLQLTVYCPDPKAQWRHSVHTALAARRLAPPCKIPLDTESAFTLSSAAHGRGSAG